MGDTYVILCECGRYTRRTMSEWLETTDAHCECGKSLERQRRELFVAVKSHSNNEDEILRDG